MPNTKKSHGHEADPHRKNVMMGDDKAKSSTKPSTEKARNERNKSNDNNGNREPASK
ncbi:MAG: hypothetical protein ABIR03_10660 [Ginsengibacter sp.]